MFRVFICILLFATAPLFGATEARALTSSDWGTLVDGGTPEPDPDPPEPDPPEPDPPEPDPPEPDPIP